MNLLALDVGSSSVKAAVLREGRVVGQIARAEFPTRYDGVRAEVPPQRIVAAIAKAIDQLGAASRKVELIALAAMAPSWVAMDRRGEALTPIITHQDRRSAGVAVELEQRVGKARHLELAGNRPFPGGISSTMCAWFVRHEPGLMRRADLLGHLSTYLHRQFCGARVTDPSNASYMGLYRTLDLRGWSDELCEAVGVDRRQLPEVRDANQIGGRLRPEAARRLGLKAGTPMLAGMMDTGAAILLAGARAGQLVNVCGSTDVLALCTGRPKPHERLLTRPLGVGRMWISVSTLAAAGSTLNWAKDQLFADLSDEDFHKLVARLSSKRLRRRQSTVQFDPYLAGDRMSMEQRRASFSGLALSTTREDLLRAMIESLARASAERLELLRRTGTPLRRQVMVSGGAGQMLAGIIHRDWPGRWTFRAEEEATLRGLGALARRED